MAKRRNTRNNKRRKNEELDETLIDVVEVRDKTQDYFEQNKGLILGLMAGLLLLVSAFIVYKYIYKAPRETQAFEQMYKAETQFAQDSFALALENPGGGFEGFLGIIESYGGTKAANLSKYYAGISYLNLGRFDDAISYLESYSPSGNITPIMKNGALGDCYSEKDELEKAAGFYKKAASAGNNDFLGPYYLNKLGLLQKHLGNKDAARDAFSQIKDKYPASEEAKDVDKYLSSL